MSGDTVIDVQNVSKSYALYRKPTDLLKEAVFGGVRHDVFWALRDVSFSVMEKQRVGIVGPNGAGKSTLLQLIAGNLQPTTGRVAVRGRISSLLSLAPAWNAEQTGLENIRFNLMVQGVKQSRLSALVEDIIDFAELGAFIYQPVKTYSTGMSARLSFAIATAVDPEILIVDEVLATGDAYFVSKAYKRMVDFCDRGRALLFVSHSTSAVQSLCNTVIWMQNGAIRQVGPAEYVLKAYELDYRRTEDETMRESNRAASVQRRKTVTVDDLADELLSKLRLVPASGDHFSDSHFVRSITVAGLSSDAVSVPLEIVDVQRENVPAGLDLLGSEWGRIHSRGGIECRMLGRVSGRSSGGHMVVRQPPTQPGSEIPVEISVEASSLSGNEALSLELLDMRVGEWRAFRVKSVEKLDGRWVRYNFAGAIQTVTKPAAAAVERMISERSLPSVEILEVTMRVDGEPSIIVQERQSFSIHVRALFRKKVQLSDVCIKFTRADGVHSFWQSSGIVGQNLQDSFGEVETVFHFDDNPFGGGEYLVTVHVTNGWDYPLNFPYSEVFCRQVSALKLYVKRELSEVNFGLVNQRVRVTVM